MAPELDKVKNPFNISKEFLKKALENGLKTKNVQIENYAASSSGGGGENYISKTYVISVKFKVPGEDNSTEIGLFIKHVQLEGNMLETFRKYDVFNTETNMYLEIIPKIEEMVGDNFMMAPKCFYASRSENVIVLRDIKEIGYQLGDRIKGLDEAHSAVVLKKLGQFHAASMVIAKENVDSVNRFKYGMFSECCRDSLFHKVLFLDTYEQMIRIVETWPDYEVIAVKLKKFLPNYIERIINISKPRDGALTVLNHGDLWVNNIMFKYDNNNAPCDLAFVDFQICMYTSPGIDIHYFLNSSVQLDVLKMKRYELLKVYYHSLKSTLKKLNFSPIPQWDDVRKEIRATELYGIFSLSGILPIISMDRNASQDNSLEAFEDADAGKKKRDIMFSSERVIKTMQYALNRVDEIGVLDSE